MLSRNVTRLVLNPVAACAARCRRMLGALARVGKRRMGGLVQAPGVAVAASSFSRIAQALRLLTLLELKLRVLLARGVSVPLPAAAVAPAPPQGGPRHAPEDTPREASLDRPDRPERPERPERPDRETFPRLDLDRMRLEDGPSLTELVADICRGLGLGREATLRAQAPFAALEAILSGKPPPAPPKRRPSMDRARPLSSEALAKEEGAPLPVTADPPDAKCARVDARGPEWPP